MDRVQKKIIDIRHSEEHKQLIDKALERARANDATNSQRCSKLIDSLMDNSDGDYGLSRHRTG